MMRTVRFLGGAAAALAALGLVACQETTKVVVDNRCETAIEVDSNSVAEHVALGYKLHWKLIPVGQTAPVRDATEPLRRIYVWVRAADSAVVPEPLLFEPSDLEASDQKLVVVIVGDLCPPP